MLGGLYWRGATRAGAATGLLLGFAVWGYTLLLPSFARSGWLPIGFVEHGPAGMAFLKPLALFGLDGLDDITHGLFWSMLLNAGSYVAVSLATRPSPGEAVQARLFVDVGRRLSAPPDAGWQSNVPADALMALVGRFLGEPRASESFAASRTAVASARRASSRWKPGSCGTPKRCSRARSASSANPTSFETC